MIGRFLGASHSETGDKMDDRGTEASSGVPAGTIQAYRETLFIVQRENPIVLRVGVRNDALLSLYREMQGEPVGCGAANMGRVRSRWVNMRGEVISTIEARERAKRRLDQRSPEALAAFILTLLHEPHGIGAYVEAFIFADEPGRAFELVEAQIRTLRRVETDYEWRHRRGDDFCAQADLVLEAIEHVVLPRDAAGALRLLERLYESEPAIVDGSLGDDDGPSRLFERAAGLFHTAGRRLPAVEVETIRGRLMARDDYGLRRHLRNGSK